MEREIKGERSLNLLSILWRGGLRGIGI